MTASAPFDLNASFPADPKHRAVLDALVLHAAEYAGCPPDVARGFADEVCEAFSAGVKAPRPDGSVGIRLERAPDKLEVVVSCGQTVRISRPLAGIP
jgi:hypothetical protein